MYETHKLYTATIKLYKMFETIKIYESLKPVSYMYLWHVSFYFHDCYHQLIQKKFETTKLYKILPPKYTKVCYCKDIQVTVTPKVYKSSVPNH